MRPFSSAELLDVWERGRQRPQPERALALLESACPDQHRDALAALSIGERDARLMLLRRWTFGGRVTSVANCAACGIPMELDFDLADVAGAGEPPPAQPLVVKAASYSVCFRLPASHDLLALLDGRQEAGQVRRRLLERCVLSVEGGERGAALPEQVAAAVIEAMTQADPLADIRLALCCPVCGHAWQVVFDIVAFYWDEIDAWARQTLREVHTLARAYGWSEAEILALGARRRQHYLEILADE